MVRSCHGAVRLCEFLLWSCPVKCCVGIVMFRDGMASSCEVRSSAGIVQLRRVKSWHSYVLYWRGLVRSSAGLVL